MDQVSEPTGPPIQREPADGVPEVIDTAGSLAATRDALRSGTGPISIDTERAQGFRYTGKAYLIQVRREGAGTFLLDPVAFEVGASRADLGAIAAELAPAEWVLHAATQDLPCLAEVNFLPQRLFDTELAGRLLGFPKVNLAALVEAALGIGLAKEHSAADWSKRPLPDAWLAYAALDVEHLVALRDWMVDRLDQAGKLEWAEQEFTHLVSHAADPPQPRPDPWRRTGGLHHVRSRAGLAMVRELWQERDAIAKEFDKAPGRVLPDKAITELAHLMEVDDKRLVSRRELRSVWGFRSRGASHFESEWLAALDRAAELDASELPAIRIEPDGPPSPKSWEKRWPDTYARYQRTKPALAELASGLEVPLENLLSPDHLRRLMWQAPETTSMTTIDETLVEFGARPWQRQLTVPVINQHW